MARLGALSSRSLAPKPVGWGALSCPQSFIKLLICSFVHLRVCLSAALIESSIIPTDKSKSSFCFVPTHLPLFAGDSDESKSTQLIVLTYQLPTSPVHPLHTSLISRPISLSLLFCRIFLGPQCEFITASQQHTIHSRFTYPLTLYNQALVSSTYV